MFTTQWQGFLILARQYGIIGKDRLRIEINIGNGLTLSHYSTYKEASIIIIHSSQKSYRLLAVIEDKVRREKSKTIYKGARNQTQLLYELEQIVRAEIGRPLTE